MKSKNIYKYIEDEIKIMENNIQNLEYEQKEAEKKASKFIDLVSNLQWELEILRLALNVLKSRHGD